MYNFITMKNDWNTFEKILFWIMISLLIITSILVVIDLVHLSLVGDKFSLDVLIEAAIALLIISGIIYLIYIRSTEKKIDEIKAQSEETILRTQQIGESLVTEKQLEIEEWKHHSKEQYNKGKDDTREQLLKNMFGDDEN